MFFIKRAGLYITKKKGKSLTIGIILFVVASLVLTGLLIESAAKKTYEIARNKLGAEVSYSTDLSSVMQQQMQNGNNGGGFSAGIGARFELPDDYSAITTKEIDTIMSSTDLVSSYKISTSLSGSASSFSYYNPSGDTSFTNDNNNGKSFQMRNNSNISIVGVDKKDKDNTLSDEITSGRYFTNLEIENGSNVIIIEETIATLNSLSVGDTIKITKGSRIESSSTDNEEVTLSYEIVGIYKTSNPTSIDENRMIMAYGLTENTMYAPYTTVLNGNITTNDDKETAKKTEEAMQNGYEVENVIFTLKNPEDIDLFISDVKKSGLDMTYRSLGANDEAYQKMVGPIQNVATTATVLVVVVVIAGALILGLVSLLSIKDRKYELGVLLSLGESKAKVFGQIICEVLIIAVVAFALATVVSNFTAQGVTNYLLNQEINSEQEENNFEQAGNRGSGFIMIRPGQSSISTLNVDVIDTLTVSSSLTDTLKLIGIGGLIIIIGNVAGAYFVLKANPKEILLSR